MDDDIFPVLCPTNAKKTYSKSFKKMVKTPSVTKDVSEPPKPPPKPCYPGVPLTTKVAVEFLLNGKLKTEVCRYCLKISPALSDLDQVLHIAGTGVLYKVSLRQMIASFYPFKANENEKYPEKICQKCVDRTLNAYFFTQQCDQAERALKNCFDDIDEKLSKLDPIDRPKKRGRQKLNPNHNVLYVEHEKVMDYAEPAYHIINIEAESLSKEPIWNEFECKRCWQVLPNLESLLNHDKTHPKSMWYNCRLCGKSFVKLTQLKKHFNVIHVKGCENKPKVDKSFKCQECGNVTEDYAQHLQHIEKHKFKTVMRYLVERKTDQLCLVCLKKSTDLVNLDKEVSIHGSCPELVGDKSLYTVLSSTLPDPKSYKYQELYVPHTANIMTISKRKRKYNEISDTNIDSLCYKLSLPEIVYKNKFKTEDFYYYVFCEPEEDSTVTTNVAKKPKIVEIDEHDTVNSLKDNENNKLIVNEVKTMSNVEHNDNNDLLTDDESNDDMMGTNAKESKIIDDELYELIDSDSSIESNESINCFTDRHINDKIETCDYYNKDDNELATNSGQEAINDNTTCFRETFKNKSSACITEFKFANPIVLEINDNGKCETKCDPVNMYNTEEISSNDNVLKIKNNLSWIFTNTSEYNTLRDTEINGTKDVFNKRCKICWIFKPNKCENCNKLKEGINETVIEEKQDIAAKKTEYDALNNNNIITSIDKNKEAEAKPEKRANKHKIDMWQCEVCLINNTNDRSTCVCCESKRYNENGNTKIIFGINKTFLPVTPEHKESEKQEKPQILEIENTSMMQLENVTVEKKVQMQMVENKNVITAQSMDVEIETDRYVANIINEEMEVEELSTPFIPTFNPTPINMLASNIGPFVGTNIQFNIGSTPPQYAKTGRKIKKVARTIPKAFHKERLDLCVTLMLRDLKKIEPSANVFVQVSPPPIMAPLENLDELLEENEIVDESKLKIDVLEDEFRVKTDSESETEAEPEISSEGSKSDTVTNIPIAPIDNLARTATKTYMNKKLVNGLQNQSSKYSVDVCSEFLTFNKRKKVKKEPVKYTCPFCNKHFISIYFLKRHIFKHNNKKAECKICNNVYNSKFLLFEHRRVAHLKPESFYMTCKVCGRNYTDIDKLQDHEQIHRIKPCELCNKVFTTQAHYENHIQKHSAKLKLHTKLHAQTCSFCEKECVNDNELSLHVNKIHLQIKPYSCDMCDRQFYTENNLKCHKKVHSMPSKETCEFCNKTLKSRKQLVIHVRKHIGVKPFGCQICGQFFYSALKVRKHMRLSHGGNFYCRICKSIFPTKYELKEHVNRDHSII
ncbi:hypothetical protein HF086_010815 [Spodoptera exigua]|uniref:Uncharacterized protein n=1 Tax=Spodoptera exigua TaxID=7107 RepID=A0A922M9Q5_SPOEX|nr:hypothetical protein HF086_010815 [Spodoptera exigua]